MTTRFIRIAAAASPFLILFAALPAAAQDDNWSGWYVGGNIGANWGNSKLNATVAPGGGSTVIPPQDVTYINAQSQADSNKVGFTGGVEGGYNWVSGSWLFGVESEFVALDVNERSNATYNAQLPANAGITYGINQRVKTSWMWSLRPRIGYVSGPWLWYGTAGVATTDAKVQIQFQDNRIPPNTLTSDNSSTKTGYIAGLGGAYSLGPNSSIKGEWLYAGFGNLRAVATSANGFVELSSKATVNTNIFRVGYDWRF